MATFDSCSSVPTTDMSLDAKGSSDMEMMQPPVPNIHPKEHLVSLQSTDKEVKSRPILTGVDDEYSFVVGPGRTESPTNITVQSPVKEERMSVNDSPVKDVNIQRKQRVVQDGRIQHKQDDVLSSLLDRGTKLRTEMIKSEIVTDQLTANSTKAQNGTDISLTEFTHRRDRTSSTGDLFKEILDVDNEGSMDDLESGVIHLVVGDNLDEKELNILRKLQGDRSLESSFSSTHDSILSDVNDPLHDSSIIEELFYKEAVLTDSESDLSDVESKLSISRSMSIDDPSNVRPPSRKSSLKSIDTPVKLSAASGGDSDSESEVVSVSRVSFDSTHIDEQDTAFEVNGISVERLALLEKVHISRVTVDTLKLESPVIPVKRKSHSKGKPPRPSKSIKTMTYFVEYKFPVAAPTRDDGSENTMATEVMRIVSKKVSSDGVVTFSHRSVFPVSFDSDVIDKWCKRLLVFKIFSRTSGQKSPTLIGVCSIPLLSVITSSDLIINADLNINDKNLPSTSSELACPTDTDSKPHVGQLKVSIELASDEKDFIASLASTKISELKRGTAIAPITNPPIMSASQEKSPVHPKEIESKIPEEKVQPYVPAYEPLTLHSLLMIPEGKDITLHGVRSHKTSNRIPQPAPPTKLGIIGKSGRDLTVRNTYLLCRTFWSNDVVRSSVCWGTSQPHYDFVQVAPVLLTNALLERTKNNFMVVEVWDKKTSAEDDKLIGIVKLSLHQFYMSFRDRRIASTLLKSQYPVVSVDTLLPIVDPFTGKQHGKLNVTLALGSNEQVSSVDTLLPIVDLFTVALYVNLDMTLLMRCISDERNIFSERDTNTESYVEHVFEVVVEGISNQPQMDNTVWAEADCFVQYHFPSQHSIQQGTVTSYRTGTTLCLPNSLFNDVKKHRIILPSRSPIQRELLAACGGVGGGSGGIPFEVWHRYYHPNVRDQVVAKGLLPLTKLCAMVTMQKIGGSSMQSYSLPLISHIADQQHPTQELKDKSAGNGFIDITIKYQSLSAGKSEGLKYSPASEAANQEVGSQICISISVLRACGLKTAAKLAAKQDSRIQYASDVGINAYVKVNLSFHNKESERITRTVARSFAPDFSHHMDFPCSLLCRETGLSLAELMETGQVTLQVWHQVTVLRSEHDVPISQHSNIFGSPNDVLLASTAVPLQDLLSNRTGMLTLLTIFLLFLCLIVSLLYHMKISMQIHTNKLYKSLVNTLSRTKAFPSSL
uniref:C2 domain-containing protein 3-like n=1 Tax=Saccoglossus kowalevskii TaxID=10224 RepID=A0ABM0ML24_SACKO|nr:PREDICTED: C2 domain-containing protein 3-like [Saccoglossus kowalevskii]